MPSGIDSNDNTPNVADWLAEADGKLAALERLLPKQLDLVGVSKMKLPGKVLWYRETLIWRVIELGRNAHESFKQNKVAAATLLTRSVVETAAAFWYLRSKIEASVTAKSLKDIDDYVMRLVFGTRNWDESPEAINVLKFVDVIEKKFKGIKGNYEQLCEVAHPNYMGTTGLFSSLDRTKAVVTFGLNHRGAENVVVAGAAGLSGALAIFEHTYEKFADEFREFLKLCEAQKDGASPSENRSSKA